MARTIEHERVQLRMRVARNGGRIYVETASRMRAGCLLSVYHLFSASQPCPPAPISLLHPMCHRPATMHTIHRSNPNRPRCGVVWWLGDAAVGCSICFYNLLSLIYKKRLMQALLKRSFQYSFFCRRLLGQGRSRSEKQGIH